MGAPQMLPLLRAVSVNRDITDFDVVELCPNEINKSPDFLAAKKNTIFRQDTTGGLCSRG
jgi:hypothetical protein